MKKILFLITSLIFLGCSTEEFDVTNEVSANAVFEPYLNTFNEEANKRGYDFRDRHIQFFLADIEEGVGGFAKLGGNKIVIDRGNWNAINPADKEALIFHELGHSVLKRKHTNEKTKTGVCLSYMRGKQVGIGCYRDLYSSLWRAYYLDELFDPKKPLPAWYTANNEYDLAYQNKKYLIQELENDSGIYNFEVDLDTLPKFVFEARFKDWRSISETSFFITQDINLNGYFFTSQPRAKVFMIGKGAAERYFRKDNYTFNEDIKVTIRKDEDVLQFFLDEKFLHAVEMDDPEHSFLNISFSPEINMDIVLFEFD